jgi:adenylate cyclase
VAIPLPSVAGACIVYLYFNLIAPPPGQRVTVRDTVVVVAVTVTLVTVMTIVGLARFRPLLDALDGVRAGADPARLPADVRRQALNAPLAHALVTMAGWLAAGVFYFPYQLHIVGAGTHEAWRVFGGIVLVGGPVAAALSFLVAEFYWRRRIPLLYPDGRLDGGFRLPVVGRLAATFLVTAVLPPLLMLLATLNVREEFGPGMPAAVQPVWTQLLRAQAYLVLATGVVSLCMAVLVARFINRPVQALRAAMVRVAAGDLAARVPVRSRDELGDLNQHFNAMVEALRQATRARELFGRYVAPAVASAALERGIDLGGELTHATAMFVDLRGFTALTQRLPAGLVVDVLNQYYALVQQECERAGGVITQFLGDGVVIVFGGPLRPLADHARRAVLAALALQHALAARNASARGEPLHAGIGICTGVMVAGNVGSGDRLTYTIVGDAVNQAARLQVKTRELGAPILITESTRAALGAADGVVLRPCGPVALKGVAEPVPVYAVEA